MKTLIRIKEGDPIPEGAKFIESVTKKTPTHTSKEYRTSYGFLWDTRHTRVYQHYDVKKYYIYEVETNENLV